METLERIWRSGVEQEFAAEAALAKAQTAAAKGKKKGEGATNPSKYPGVSLYFYYSKDICLLCVCD